MAYKVEFAPAAARQIKKLPTSSQKRIITRIENLASNPGPPGSKQLEAKENLYRLPAGDYRIIYQIQDTILLILVVKIGHRRDVYRKWLTAMSLADSCLVRVAESFKQHHILTLDFDYNLYRRFGNELLILIFPLSGKM